MAVSVAWKVEIGYPNTMVNFTSRTAGLDVNEQLQLNSFASFKATITLNNFDGALTPNGGGTYASTDWFAQYVRISATSSSPSGSETVEVFTGMPIGFDLVDDGEFSTVTLTCDDLWSIGGRTQQISVGPFAATDLNTAITNLALWSGSFPTFGFGFVSGYGYTNFGPVTDNDRLVESGVTVNGITYADYLDQMLLPAMNGWAWPGGVSLTSLPGALYIHAWGVTQSMTRRSIWRYPLVFDPPSTISGTDLPFTAVNQGWNIDKTINTATYTSLFAISTPQTAINTAAAQAYGSKAVAFNQTATPFGGDNILNQELVNRFAVPTFAPQELTLNTSTIKSYCANAAYASVAKLFDLMYGFIDKATITWTGAGAASQTATCVILGKRFRATPSDTSITLTLGKWTDYHSFILDTDKLDTDRLG